MCIVFLSFFCAFVIVSQWQRSGWSLILTECIVLSSVFVEIHRMTAFVAFKGSYFLTVNMD